MARLIFKRSERRKWCNRCQQYKSYEAFGRDKSKPEGLSPYCLECERKRARERYRSDPTLKARQMAASRRQREEQRAYVLERNRALAMRHKLRQRYKRLQELPPDKRIYRGKYQELWEEIVFSENAARKGSWKDQDTERK
jgi:hypothetical protein